MTDPQPKEKLQKAIQIALRATFDEKGEIDKLVVMHGNAPIPEVIKMIIYAYTSIQDQIPKEEPRRIIIS